MKEYNTIEKMSELEMIPQYDKFSEYMFSEEKVVEVQYGIYIKFGNYSLLSRNIYVHSRSVTARLFV